MPFKRTGELLNLKRGKLSSDSVLFRILNGFEENYFSELEEVIKGTVNPNKSSAKVIGSKSYKKEDGYRDLVLEISKLYPKGGKDDLFHSIVKAAILEYNNKNNVNGNNYAVDNYLRDESIVKCFLAEELRRNPEMAEKHFTDGTIPTKVQKPALKGVILVAATEKAKTHEEMSRLIDSGVDNFKKSNLLSVTEESKKWLIPLLEKAQSKVKKVRGEYSGEPVYVDGKAYTIPKNLHKAIITLSPKLSSSYEQKVITMLDDPNTKKETLEQMGIKPVTPENLQKELLDNLASLDGTKASGKYSLYSRDKWTQTLYNKARSNNGMSALDIIQNASEEKGDFAPKKKSERKISLQNLFSWHAHKEPEGSNKKTTTMVVES
ncbi:hypothetical protein [Piscirickettsia litoralis]|uniref:Uncharacterized protein n=1 Tax=Piscirickettsia litoralis TaxID=1891921 RepID=A0ABX3A0T9_9GAMM|nr:hypothetical protein [Piscirickettsia litoralis]ODN42476.1 hypothetical protein BGC07_05465 [Piscirickettsia litoralis]